MKPYVAGIQPQGEGWIKLNTNENPHPIDVKLEIDLNRLRLYPDPDSGELCETIAGIFGCSRENVFAGNGSDEVLALAFQAFFSGKETSMPEVSYGFYPVWAEMYNVKPRFIPLKNWEIDWAEYGGNCIIANPNAPTGLALDIREIPKGGVVIIDEAYIDFADVPSTAPLIKKYDNLLVVRTFSKSYSLAGLRVGFAIGHEKLIGRLKMFKNCFNSYPLDALAQHIAANAVRQQPKTAEVKKTREWLKTQIKCLDSQANFVFWEIDNSKRMYEHLLEHKILVRYWDKFPGRLRVSIGTDKEMEAFLACTEKLTKPR
ncbi:MAG: aminotransferase class I/II-fold pyridoxal phosphate-dependent enzyme [Defluviitaleaceae bacterium]|nr:aminotransferase class I/II-fold pyridoxal phosphate-dependent enzyme [Defluviitaleaceae bacterium]